MGITFQYIIYAEDAISNILEVKLPYTNAFIEPATFSTDIVAQTGTTGIAELKTLFSIANVQQILSATIPDVRSFLSTTGMIDSSYFLNKTMTVFIPNNRVLDISDSDIPTDKNSVIYFPMSENETFVVNISHTDGSTSTTIVETFTRPNGSSNLKVSGVLYKIGDPILFGKKHILAFLGFGSVAFTPESQYVPILPPPPIILTSKQIRAAMVYPDFTMRLKAQSGREIIRTLEGTGGHLNTATSETVTAVEQGRVYLRALNSLHPPPPNYYPPITVCTNTVPDISYNLSRLSLTGSIVVDMSNIDVFNITMEPMGSIVYTPTGATLTRASLQQITVRVEASNCTGTVASSISWTVGPL